ncbi:MAG: hypothetical protein VKK04_16025 [Synechococcales bacterium]|nr:hypothetical protein [Synechococcales bacterium]
MAIQQVTVTGFDQHIPVGTTDRRRAAIVQICITHSVCDLSPAEGDRIFDRFHRGTHLAPVR